MATIRDVARQAGVSVATVSRTLSGDPRVSDQTRRRVLQAIEELDYRPDQVARSLRRRRNNLIGLIVSSIENVFFTEVAHAAEQAAHQRGYNLIVCNTDENPQREESYLEILNQQLVSGVILAPAPGEAKHLIRFIEGGLPIVLINRRLPHLPCSSITSDDEEAAYQCVTHLIREGRRRIAAITGLSGVFTTQERLRGYRRALEEAGMAVDPSFEVSGQACLTGGYEAARTLMQRVPQPDALFVFNNLMTQGAVMALQDLGLRWPDQVDVAGFGAFEVARLYRPPLTLIAQPTHEMGRRAVELLIDQVEHRRENRPQMVVLRNRLIPREAWLRPDASRRIAYDN
ncbi:MAG: LacI family DNA-binding transcriptional regulator [Anaerolineae bacterium]|nr:LacI family transcriptional regulator [Anaerolineae bacterium]MDW8098804.1 LacI family DNA-binding transcriptional regulator [Anaerolineae bacterium]